MIAKADLAANHAIVFNRYAAADAGLRGNDHALADVAVVAHVDHVVELRSASNSCLSQRRAIDASMRAEFNVVFYYDFVPTCGNL